MSVYILIILVNYVFSNIFQGKKYFYKYHELLIHKYVFKESHHMTKSQIIFYFLFYILLMYWPWKELKRDCFWYNFLLVGPHFSNITMQWSHFVFSNKNSNKILCQTMLGFLVKNFIFILLYYFFTLFYEPFPKMNFITEIKNDVFQCIPVIVWVNCICNLFFNKIIEKIFDTHMLAAHISPK